ncbi:MAG: YncE family protein [Candidatus Marinimicrobia bacterium]|nr:YncE family protein [Candidatus Neomarinimicrobiota bacterium]MBT5440109.1 YncE family protein [Candidatus Neomarinimicrobiota bacterium]MBT7524609.1 YncE family protein [Candidatus Neomarinimicrobiota bacterium]
MKRFTKFILIYLIGIFAISAKDYYIYCATESEDEVALIRFDGKTAYVEKRIPVGVWPVEIEGPHGITVSPDGDFWYLSMAHGVPYGHLYKYKTGTDEMVDRVELGLFPATMGISNATGLIYIVNFNLHGGHTEPSTVSIVDPEEMIEIDRVETGIMPHGSRLLNNGLKHYSVAMMSGMLYEIDAMTMQITRTLSTAPPKKIMNAHSGHNMKKMDHSKMNMGMKKNNKMAKMDHKMPPEKPTWVYPHPNDNLIYVVNNGTDNVVEIDVKKWEVVRTFKTDKAPYNCEVSQDGKYLVVTYKGAAKTGVWNLKTGKEIAKFNNTRKVTHGVVISPDSRYAFVSVEGIGKEPGSVEIFDLKELKSVTIAEIGKQAGGIAFWKMED